MIEAMIVYAMSFIGTPYIWGGNNPVEGFDCSGYVLECLKSIGVNYTDRTAHQLYKSLSKLNWRSGLKEGSILFFGQPYKITHVEIALSTQQMIGASGGGPKITSREQAARHNAFVKVRPIVSRSDLVAAIIPNIDNVSVNKNSIDIL